MTAQLAFYQGIKTLTESKINDAETSARYLLAHVLSVEPGQLAAHLQTELLEDQAAHYQRLLDRRSKHEPIWYIVGEQTFANLPIHADQRVLIPRPETEELVELTLDYIENNHVDTVLEVGTGSGAIILAIADQLKTSHPEIDLIATDQSAEALLIAQYNAKRLNFDEKVTFIEADCLKSQFADGLLEADVIVANLPYIPSARIAELEPDVRDFEPHQALDGGPDGLNIYRTLFRQINELETKPQAVFCEIDETHGQSFPDLVKQHWPDAKVEIKKDLAGLVRYGIINLS